MANDNSKASVACSQACSATIGITDSEAHMLHSSEFSKMARKKVTKR